MIRIIPQKKRMEQDGLILDSSQHWETWTGKVYLYYARKRDHTWHNAYVTIPVDIIRHLNLKHMDQVTVAIKLP